MEATATAEGIAFVAIPNTLVSRIVAYHGTNGEHPPQTSSSIPELLGVLTLGSDDGPLHRVAVTAAGVEHWTPTLRLKAAGKPEETASLDLWAADGNPSPQGVRGFQVVLTFEDRARLAIPVEDDDFDLAHAAVPSPFHLLRLDKDSATADTFFGTATLKVSGEICLRLRTEEPGKPVAEGYRCYPPTDASYPAVRRHVGPIKVGEEKVIAPFG